MPLTIADVSIFTRRRKTEGRSSSYYAQLRNPATGKFKGGRMASISDLAKKLGLKYEKITKPEASWIVMQAIDKGILKYDAEEDNASLFLIDYVEQICAYDTSPWVRSEFERTRIPLSKKRVNNLLRAFQIYAKPLIARDVTLLSFSRADALALQKAISKNGASPDNINMAMNAIKVAYKYAMQTGVANINPTDSIKPFIVERKEKQIFTRSEAIAVLSILASHANETRSRKIVYLAAKLAVFSGMREGEIRAFQIRKMTRIVADNGKATDYYKITVDSAWKDDFHMILQTKEKYNRTTVIHKDLAEELLSFAAEEGRRDDEILFKASKNKSNKISDDNIPVVKNLFQKYFNEATEEIGIDKITRKQRGIDFNSLRHFYDSESKSVAQQMEVYKEKIRLAVGHKSKSVDELIYTHDTATTLVTLGIMSEHLLDIDEDMDDEEDA